MWANVRRATGRTRHIVGGVDVSLQIASVELRPEDGGWYLLCFDADGQPLADTWHQTRELAMQQAEFEFGIETADWQELA